MKVSDKDFSLYASYQIHFFWEDDRIFVDDPNPLPYYNLDTSLLDKFWSPKNKAFINHAKESRQNAGLLHHKIGFGLMNQSGKLSFEVSVSTKPEITCPMQFSWFPFDSQECHFIMGTTDPDTRLINLSPHEEGSRVMIQNIQLGYDITIQDLPDRLKKKAIDEVLKVWKIEL